MYIYIGCGYGAGTRDLRGEVNVLPSPTRTK